RWNNEAGRDAAGMARASVRSAAGRDLRGDDLFSGLDSIAAGLTFPVVAGRAADPDAGSPPLATAASGGDGERCPAVDRPIKRLLLDVVLSDAVEHGTLRFAVIARSVATTLLRL